jgi:hypothetical protein
MLKRILAALAGGCLIFVLLFGRNNLSQSSRGPQSGSVMVYSGSTVEVQEATFFAFDARSVPFRRNLHLTMVPADKHPTPVLTRGARGFFDELRAEYYGTVIKINGKYQMWYLGYGFADPNVRTFDGVVAQVGYADSLDGIHWSKPNLGMVSFHGGRAHNTSRSERACLLRT